MHRPWTNVKPPDPAADSTSHDSAETIPHAVTDQVDAGWYEWVAANLGRDAARATAAARAASAAAAQGLGFNAAADAARASWEADRLAQIAVLTKDDPTHLPSALIAATAIAVGGALASIALILVLVRPGATCTDFCPSFRMAAYTFLWGNIAVGVLHAFLFVLMWRRRAALAWWGTVGVVGMILLFDLVGELTVVVALANPHVISPIETVGLYPALVTTTMLLLADQYLPGTVWVTLSYHWLLLHLAVVELPILVLLSRGSVRRWCRVRLMIGRGR